MERYIRVQPFTSDHVTRAAVHHTLRNRSEKNMHIEKVFAACEEKKLYVLLPTPSTMFAIPTIIGSLRGRRRMVKGFTNKSEKIPEKSTHANAEPTTRSICAIVSLFLITTKNITRYIGIHVHPEVRSTERVSRKGLPWPPKAVNMPMSMFVKLEKSIVS